MKGLTDMDYSRIYHLIIENRKNNPIEGYTERHHIIPKSIGGTDDKENLVDLSAREHFFVHLLLTKIYSKGTPNYYKMVKAFMMMLVCRSDGQERFLTSRRYEKLRAEFALSKSMEQSGPGNSQYGQPRSETTKEKISQTLLKRNSESRKLKMKEKAEKQKLKEQKRTADIELHRKYYKIYSNVGWEKFVEITGYRFSKPNLVSRFARLLPEFVPQNGKRRS